MKSFWFLSLLGVLGLAVECYGVKPEKAAAKPEPEKVDLFAAMESGDIEVKLIPKDSTTGNVLITNKTKKPLSIRLPDAFAGVPVAAQFGCPGGPGGGGFGGGGGGGFFNVAPEKVGKIKVVTVCLEHGKDDPNPRIPYELRPIETFTENQKLIEVVKMVARGELDQHSAQAAAWHLANDMSWQTLAQKVGKKHLDGSTEPYFSKSHLERALAATRVAAERAEKSETKSPGELESVQVSSQR